MRAFLLSEQKKVARNKGLFKNSATVLGPAQLVSTLVESHGESLWITDNSSLLTKALSSSELLKNQGKIRKNSNIILLGDLEKVSTATLSSLFKKMIVVNANVALEELMSVLRANNAEDLVISGSVDLVSKTLSLVRGDLEELIVPLSAFKKSGNNVVPKFNDFSIIDHGQTIKFGNYETAVDALLYEYDSEYRKKIKSQRVASEKSFGASLKRLRLQKGLSQTEFKGIDAKVIGRIERGEVKKPRGKTLDKIAENLGVASKDISSY